jgi:guanylate kinase
MRSADPEIERAANPPRPGGVSPPAAVLAPLIVISGPAGVGKTTVVERLLSRSTLPLRRAVTATTRRPRPGEEDGISYHFWTPEQFSQAIATGQMLEWAQVHGKDFYGIPRAEVDRYRANGKGVILVIDVKGAASIRSLYQRDHLSIFINAPSFADLEQRLRARGGDSGESIQNRLNTAREELARAHEFDHTILNCDLEHAVHDLETLIRKCFPSTPTEV